MSAEYLLVTTIKMKVTLYKYLKSHLRITLEKDRSTSLSSYVYSWVDMERDTYTHLQIYVLDITFMCCKPSFCRRKKPSEDCKANLAFLKSAKLISFHLPSQGQQCCHTAFADEDFQTTHTMIYISQYSF